MCRQWADRSGFTAEVVETVNRGKGWGPFLAVNSQLDTKGSPTVMTDHIGFPAFSKD